MDLQLIKRYWKLIAIAVVVVALLILIVNRAAAGARAESDVPSDIETGVNYLQALENTSPDQVEEVIKYNRQQDILAYRDTLIQQIESGELNIWSQFTDYCLLGDSRAVGFYFHEYMPESLVLADGGATIRHFKEHIPDIVALDVSNVYLCYGLNDVSIGYWPTPAAYVEEFAQTIQELKDAVPGVNIYINSILPAQEIAFETESSWRQIPEYSAAVKEMCDTIDNCCYVDNDDLAEKYADYYESDGIHVNKLFYPYWATNMIMATYNHELDLSDNAS